MRKVTSQTQLRAHLNGAMNNQRAVTIRYEKPVKGGIEVSRRRIEIHGFKVSKAGDISIECYDHKSNATRTFRLDRITHLTLHRTGKLADYRVPVVADTQAVEDDNGDVIKVTAWDYEWHLIA